MKKIKLGATEDQVSLFCLGTMYFGTKVDKDTSFRLLDSFADAGGNFLDTSNNYARWVEGFKGGESETLLGEWLKQRRNRSQLFIATKSGFAMPGVERGLKAKQIEEECNKSLKRFGVDTIDLYYAHVDDRNTSLEETLEVYDRLVRAGKIRHIGASNYLAWRLEEARGVSESRNWPAFCCIQQKYTLLKPKPAANFDPQIFVNDDLLDYCQNRKLTLLAYSPLLGGAYVRDDKGMPEQFEGPQNETRMKALKAIAEEKGVTVNEVILAWMQHHKPFVLPLLAASTEEQLIENLGALDVNLSEEEMERLK